MKTCCLLSYKPVNMQQNLIVYRFDKCYLQIFILKLLISKPKTEVQGTKTMWRNFVANIDSNYFFSVYLKILELLFLDLNIHKYCTYVSRLSYIEKKSDFWQKSKQQYSSLEAPSKLNFLWQIHFFEKQNWYK